MASLVSMCGMVLKPANLRVFVVIHFHLGQILLTRCCSHLRLMKAASVLLLRRFFVLFMMVYVLSTLPTSIQTVTVLIVLQATIASATHVWLASWRIISAFCNKVSHGKLIIKSSFEIQNFEPIKF